MKVKTITVFIILCVQMVWGQSEMNQGPITKICSKGVYESYNMKEYYSPVEDKSAMCIPKNNGIPNSNWYSWSIKHPGSIEFLLTPYDLNDDLDFEVYLELSPGDLRIVRCMASGPNIGDEDSDLCLGVTGMVTDNNNIRETLGCDPTKTNLTAPIYTVKGQTYYLRVINFSSDKGFSLNLMGTAALSGTFETSISCKVENNKSFLFSSDLSETAEDDYTYHWNFGPDAFPATDNKKNPWPVRFESEGPKQIVLETWDKKEGCYQQAFYSLIISSDQKINKPASFISIYPNPFYEWTNISIDAAMSENELIEFSIWDIEGKRVDEFEMINQPVKKINLTTLSAGVYLLRASSKNIDQTIELFKINAQEN